MKEFYVFESYPGKKYLPIEVVETAIYEDFEEAGYNPKEFGIENNGEKAEDFASCRWWDGNNWQITILEINGPDNVGMIKGEIENCDTPDPAFNFYYNLVLENGEKIPVTQSNCSGSISPFYFEY